jgi:hypothetical protein
MLKLHLNFAFGTLEIDAEDEKELIEQTAFWQAMPAACPVCGASTRLNVRNAGSHIYREVICAGTVQHTMKIQVHKNAEQTLYIRDVWMYWDAEKKQEIVVWENGRPTSHVNQEVTQPETRSAQRDAQPDAPDAPPTFRSPDDAVDWAVSAGRFTKRDAAVAAYNRLKADKKPQSAGEMWALWLGLVNNPGRAA